jgi:hypothetical protein
MSDGAARWLAAEAREVAAARHQSREERRKSRCGGGGILAGGGEVPFLKGADGRRNQRGVVRRG